MFLKKILKRNVKFISLDLVLSIRIFMLILVNKNTLIVNSVVKNKLKPEKNYGFMVVSRNVLELLMKLKKMINQVIKLKKLLMEKWLLIMIKLLKQLVIE
jgi:hypothetical protein